VLASQASLPQPFLSQQGFHITLIEKKENFISGMGICLPPNATFALKKMNILNKILKKSFTADNWKVTTESGENLIEINMQQYFSNETPFISTERSVLHRAIMDLTPIPIQPGLQFDKIEENNENTLSVRFQDGSIKKFEFMIAADGLYSKIRQQLFPQNHVGYLGVACYRLLVPKPPYIDRVHFALAQGGFMLAHPVNKKLLYCGIVFPQSEKQKTNMDKQFCSVARQFKALFPDVLSSPSLNPLPGWMETVSSPVFAQDRVLFMGDAGHGCATSLQQGAALALEDAIVFSDQMGLYGDFLKARDAFIHLRRPRIEWVTQSSNECMLQLNKKYDSTERALQMEHIKKEGPQNFKLWKKLFQENPFNYSEKINLL